LITTFPARTLDRRFLPGATVFSWSPVSFGARSRAWSAAGSAVVRIDVRHQDS
jgi:hypothetical protein